MDEHKPTPTLRTAIESRIKLYNNHPTRHQKFIDCFPIYSSPRHTELVVSALTTHALLTHDVSTIAAIVCPESQGFMLGPLVAARLGLPCVPVRKKGKLPGEVLRGKYGKWHGEDEFEIQRGAFEEIGCGGENGDASGGHGSGESEKTKTGVLVVDDGLASGGSVGATKRLVERLGMVVLEGLFIYEATMEEFRVEQRRCMGEMKVWSLVELTEESLGAMEELDGLCDEDGRKLCDTSVPVDVHARN